MVDFLKRLVFFLVFPVLVCIAAIYRADGQTDPFYLRFTTPRQESLVLGGSRAAQGIQPKVLNDVLRKGGYPANIFNYSFTVGNSDYGRAYYESILKKLDPDSHNGVFILSVNPSSISRGGGRTDKEEEIFEQKKALVAKVMYVNMNPNPDYLFHAFNLPLLRTLIPTREQRIGKMLLHQDGWLEVRVKRTPAIVTAHTREKVRMFREKRFMNATLSQWRLDYLAKSIDLLKEHGTVLILRLPTYSEIHDLEEQYMPRFNPIMEELAAEKDVTYLAIPPDDEKWDYLDGNHLTQASGAKVSRYIGQHLLKEMRK